MSIISSSVASVSSAYAPTSQTSAPMRGDAAMQLQMAQALVTHASHAGTAAVVSMSSGGQMRHASYGSAKSTDAAFEKEKRAPGSDKSDSAGKSSSPKHIDVRA